MSQFIITGTVMLSVRAHMTDDVFQWNVRPLPTVNSWSTSWADVTFHCHPQCHSHVIPRSASASPQVHKPNRKWCIWVSKESVCSSSYTNTHTHRHMHASSSTACPVHLLAVTSLCAATLVVAASFLLCGPGWQLVVKNTFLSWSSFLNPKVLQLVVFNLFHFFLTHFRDWKCVFLAVMWLSSELVTCTCWVCLLKTCTLCFPTCSQELRETSR